MRLAYSGHFGCLTGLLYKKFPRKDTYVSCLVSCYKCGMERIFLGGLGPGTAGMLRAQCTWEAAGMALQVRAVSGV